ncbi:FAD-dependent oxidoreductase, partial [uncultured Aeromicrobium sp.]|uniref:FAD-dependent oxidoreductase n=1 Tax=uncultured Aeromicrobium sp. TaxID=337820 RepID=UPI0025DFBFC9
VAEALEAEVDYISVMVGNNNRLEARTRHWPPAPARPGLFRGVVRTVKKYVSAVPVAGVGRILTMDLAEDIVASGDADMVGMVRAQIADPELLPLSKAGRATEVRPCIGANVCVNSLIERRPLRCLINPDVAESTDLDQAQPLDGTSAVVVGGGPAGLEAARRLAVRGAAVTLFEQRKRLGGRMAQWADAPTRREAHKWIQWLERQLRDRGADLQLGVRVDPARIASLRPDHLVIATGAEDAPVSVPSDGSVDVLTPWKALEPGVVSGRAVVFDAIGDLDGALIADYLHGRDAEVVLVTSRLHVGEGEGINTLVPMLKHLAEARIAMHERFRPVRIAHGEVELAGVLGGPSRRLRADVLITWAGGTPNTELARDLRQRGLAPLLIGDALRPRRVVDATADAKRVTDPLRPSLTQVI